MKILCWLVGHNSYHHPHGFTFCRRCKRVVKFDAGSAWTVKRAR